MFLIIFLLLGFLPADTLVIIELCHHQPGQCVLTKPINCSCRSFYQFEHYRPEVLKKIISLRSCFLLLNLNFSIVMQKCAKYKERHCIIPGRGLPQPAQDTRATPLISLWIQRGHRSIVTFLCVKYGSFDRNVP